MADTPRRKKKTKNPNAVPKAAQDLRAILDQFDVHNSSVGVVHGDQRFTYLANTDADALSYANAVNQNASYTSYDSSQSVVQNQMPASAAPQDEFFAKDHEQQDAQQFAQQDAAHQYTQETRQVAMFYPQYPNLSAPQPAGVSHDVAMSHRAPDAPMQEVSLPAPATNTGNLSYAPNPFMPNPPAYPQQVNEHQQAEVVPNKDGPSTFVGLNAMAAGEGGANLYDPFANQFGPMPSNDGPSSRCSQIITVAVVLLLVLGVFAWIIVPSVFIARRDTVRNNWVASMCPVLEQSCEWRSTDALGSPCLGESWGEKSSGRGWVLTPNCRWIDPDAFSIKDGIVTKIRARSSLSSNPEHATYDVRSMEQLAERVGPQRVGLRYTACHTQYTISMQLGNPSNGKRVTLEETCRDNQVSVKPWFNTDSDFCQQFRKGVRCDLEAANNGDEDCLPSELSKVGNAVPCWVDPKDSSRIEVEGRKSVQDETWALGALVLTVILLCCCGGCFYFLRSR